jgi:hypothetical protein
VRQGAIPWGGADSASWRTVPLVEHGKVWVALQPRERAAGGLRYVPSRSMKRAPPRAVPTGRGADGGGGADLLRRRLG